VSGRLTLKPLKNLKNIYRILQQRALRRKGDDIQPYRPKAARLALNVA